MNCQPTVSVIPALGQVNSPSLSDCEETTILWFSVRERTAGMVARCHPLWVAMASSLTGEIDNDHERHRAFQRGLPWPDKY
jgi:hypothetical protein